MKRVILDTNVYGELAIDPKLSTMKLALTGAKNFVFYGIDIIRKELRETSKTEKFAGRNLRIILLSMYDDVTRERVLKVTSEVTELANDFYKAYKELGGLKPESEMRKDFLIVSAAVMHNLDVVVSNDERTMLTENAIKAYRLIAAVKKKKLPNLILYDEFRRWFV